MKACIKLLFLGLTLTMINSCSLLAMQPEATAAKPVPGCCQKGGGCSKCFLCCTKTANVLVPIGLQIAGIFLPGPEAKAILALIQTACEKAGPSLTALAKKCADDPKKEPELTEEQLKMLAETGLIKPDGSIDPKVKALIQIAVPTKTTRRAYREAGEGSSIMPLTYEQLFNKCAKINTPETHIVYQIVE